MKEIREQPVRNSEYLRRTEYSAKGFYVDGNAARQIEIEQPLKKQLSEEERAQRRRRRREAEMKKAAVRKQNAVRTVVALAAFAVVTILVVFALNGTVRNNILAKDISGLEVRYQKLLSQNDSKKFDIDRSVDLNTVIQTATTEYGMVRSSIGQIVTYKADQSEYIQQMAQVPVK